MLFEFCCPHILLQLSSSSFSLWLHICMCYTGCKENHFYSLPCGQAEATIYWPRRCFILPQKLRDEQNQLISQFFCYSNSSKNITCPSGKLKTGFTSPIAKSTSPGLSNTTFFACWLQLLSKLLIDLFSFHVIIRRQKIGHHFTFCLDFDMPRTAKQCDCFYLILFTLMLLLRAILGGTFSLALVWSGVGVDLAVAVVSIFVY